MPTRAVVLIWVLLRLPVCVLIAYLLRYRLLNAIERHFDIFGLTAFVIGVLSTPVTRCILIVALFTVLVLIILFVRHRSAIVGYAILVSTWSVVVAALVIPSIISLRRVLLVSLILAASVASYELVGRFKQFPRLWNTIMLVGVGVVELFLWREYWQWVRQQVCGHRNATIPHGGVTAVIPGLLLTSLVFAVLLPAEPLLRYERRIRMSPGVQLLESGLSYNWIQLDPTGTYLYVTGHDLPHLRRYDLRDLSASPVTSDVHTGGAQGFAYDRRANAIYVFNTTTRQLLSIDATTLAGRPVAHLPELSPGDMWMAVEPSTNTLTLASEADLQIGAPFMVLDRATGRILAHADLDAGNVLLHPTRPFLYLTFFRRRSEVMLYDLQKKSVTRSGLADRRAERMVFSRRRNEVWVTSPMESRVMRFQADDLRPRGYIPAPFGVRAIAVDERRDLLLCGSIATGRLAVIDPETGTHLRTYYVGPWLRTIELHVESGTAYVSSRGALYRVDYAADPVAGG